MADVNPQKWNEILDQALENRAVCRVMAAEVPTSFRSDLGILEGISWRGDSLPHLGIVRAAYLLSMVAFTLEPFEYSLEGRLVFFAGAVDRFVVGVVGPVLRDNGRGRREAVLKALEDLEAVA